MKIGIIGCGAFAIALSTVFENVTDNIMMWTKIEKEYEELTTNYTNKKVLDYKLNKNIIFTTSLKELLKENTIIILAIPAKFVKDTIKELKPFYNNQEILIATKGMIENPSILLYDYIQEELNTKKISYISGPTFAIDLVKKEPTGLTIATKNDTSLTLLKNVFNNISYITFDYTKDIIGVQICGILKNIIAIGSGILNGMNINNSTKVKYLKDTSIEIQNIILNLNGDKNTFNTYSGIGDFILTTTNTKSRNYTFGALLGQNKDYTSYIQTTTIEGLENLKCIYYYLKNRNIKVKIIDTLYDIIYLKKDKNLLIDYLKDKE